MTIASSFTATSIQLDSKIHDIQIFAFQRINCEHDFKAFTVNCS